MREGFKFVRIEQIPIGPGMQTDFIAIVNFGDGETRWNEESIKMRMNNALCSTNLSEEAKALAEIRTARKEYNNANHN